MTAQITRNSHSSVTPVALTIAMAAGKAKGHDRYKRVLAQCRAAGKDIAAEAVLSGWALAHGGLCGKGLWDVARGVARFTLNY
ncbi:hypothetical protein ABLE91_01060 [Aquabacter sp. CN5-332]|uniref:hypothetical protein n=1 Tax=Aquabacter sp. CN5-332 TaxID=3156608 RepID=UPI0032B34DAC